MSVSMFIYINQDEAFNLEKLKTDLQSIEGVRDINREGLKDSPLACHYEYDNYEVIVRLGDDLKSISVKRDSETSLNLAFELQKREERPLRIFDESYTYHFSIKGFQLLEEIKRKAYEENYFDEEALKMEEAQAA